jgi:hypothetical protein
VLVSRNHGIDSYWKRLGPESNCEYTHPELSPKQEAAFAMSLGSLPSHKTKGQVEEAQVEEAQIEGMDLCVPYMIRSGAVTLPLE